MSLTNIVRNTAYALTASLALTNPLYSAEKPVSAPNQTQSQRGYEKASSYEYFRDLVDSKASSRLTLEQERALEKKWPKYTKEEKRTFVEIYADAKKYLKKLEEEVKKLSQEEQEDFYSSFSEKYFPDKPKIQKKKPDVELVPGPILKLILPSLERAAVETARKEYMEKYPFFNPDNPGLEDEIIFYLSETEIERKNKELFEDDFFFRNTRPKNK